MRRGTAIGGFRHPLSAHLHFGPPGIHHRFDGNDHAFLQTRPATRLSIVREVRLIVHLCANAVTHKLPHNGKTVLLDPTLHRVPDITQPVARPHLVDRSVQRLTGHIEKLLQLRADVPHGDGNS